MLDKARKWISKNQDALIIGGALVTATVVMLTAVKALSDIAHAAGVPEGDDIDWDAYEPERPMDVMFLTDNQDVMYDNRANNDHITNALRLVNAVVDGKRDADWAMPIVQSWLEQVE